MKVLDLFSGIGGFSLGLEAAGMETVAFCEYDKHARKVLTKNWPGVPIYNDIRSLDGHKFKGSVDVICGGFPCQDLSIAGFRAGFSGERSSLYREMLRIIGECRPKWAIFENVTGLLTGDSGRWFGQFLYDLAEIGLDAEWHCIPASELGANHHRDRVWVIAYPNMQRCEGGFKEEVVRKPRLSPQLMRAFKRWPTRQDIPSPKLSGGDDGVSNRAHRLRQLGNAVVPQVVEMIGLSIMESMK